MYCRKPSVESGSRRAAPVNQSSGIAVRGPASRSSRSVSRPRCRNTARPLDSAQASQATANGKSSIVSIVSPTSAPTGTSLRRRPYIPNEKASVREIQGSDPTRSVSHSTPAAASATAIRFGQDSRSRSSTTPSATLTIGLMK